ncbi:hypothetical protein OSH08_19930 [Kaistia geumhonensis]|uniref:Tfp pilus assembly protein PilN n=1 Tax=Kaistia geumhonensis TaxID=410839 RepID=A0ABU0MBQ6_9HYPH|nr:hypothetical protein [Kaistia geumhonensis]MCX5481281.1 hypothetical protein [Kaistia geumhonensis]MDQ0518342.1 Tfp pilus assembly protein PilN [Kaistia geumhonensis]
MHERFTFGRDPRRETRTRRAFMLWMAAYTAALVLVAIVSLTGGVSQNHGEPTQQARVMMAPQSALDPRPATVLVDLGDDG